MQDIINKLAKQTGVNPQDVLNMAQGVANMIEREGGAECFASATESDRGEMTRAYVEAYTKAQKRMAISYISQPETQATLQNFIRNRAA